MRLLLLVLALSALLVAGCGGDDDAPVTTPSAELPAETTPDAGDRDSDTESSGDVVDVAMRDIQFDPQAVTVSVGQTVRWTNEDDVQHDADALNGEFESELYGKGGTQEWKPEEAGVVEYVCSVHPNMTGTVTVE